MSLREIVRAFGGDLYAGGRRASIPAPGHSTADRSVSLRLAEGRVLVHCFGAADWREVLDALRQKGLIDDDNALTGVAGLPARRTGHEPTDRDRIAAAERLWSEGRPLAGTLSERHLRRRHIRRALPGTDALRHHPAVPIAAYRRRGWTQPALLAAIRDLAGAVTAVEVTYLDRDGARARRLKVPRKTIGVVRPGSAVRLDSPAADMLVGEGVFTTLSASARFARPGWALLAIRNLAAWTPSAGVRRVLIAGDRGPYGEAAAAGLRDRLAALGLEAEVALPDPPFGDWNDVAAAEAARAG